MCQIWLKHSFYNRGLYVRYLLSNWSRKRKWPFFFYEKCMFAFAPFVPQFSHHVLPRFSWRVSMGQKRFKFDWICLTLVISGKAGTIPATKNNLCSPLKPMVFVGYFIKCSKQALKWATHNLQNPRWSSWNYFASPSINSSIFFLQRW